MTFEPAQVTVDQLSEAVNRSGFRAAVKEEPERATRGELGEKLGAAFCRFGFAQRAGDGIERDGVQAPRLNAARRGRRSTPRAALRAW
ncbi:MAG: hypothetical protein ACREK9_11520 [Candidatus Rokuibacteriota bacterium]